MSTMPEEGDEAATAAAAGVERMDLTAPDNDSTHQPPTLMEKEPEPAKVIANNSSANTDDDNNDDNNPIPVDSTGSEDAKADAATDDIADDSSCSSTTSTDSSMPDINDDNNDNNNDSNMTTDQVNDALVQAAQYKDEGNTHFQAGQMEQAARAYRRGCHALKQVRASTGNPAFSDDPQIVQLLTALLANRSMVSYKQSKYQQCIRVATQALVLDATNVKVLYRRACAYRQLGDFVPAKNDLKTALQHDPRNRHCRKEWAAIQQELVTTKASQQKALAKAFGGGSNNNKKSFLYHDKEAEQQQRQQEAQEKKIREQELYKKRKLEWEDECVHRMARNEPAISFDEWEKERKTKEKKQQKENDEKRRNEERQQKANELSKKQQQQPPKKKNQEKESESHDDDDDDDLTPEELAMMRGYKKTSDGRTTSYFNRELSEDAKQAIGDIAPKRIDNTTTAAAATASGTLSAPPLKLSMTTEGASAWNQAGTWEEKNTTAWCESELTKRLEATSVTANVDDNDDCQLYYANIVSVEELTGDASVAFAGGKKRYIFDFHAKLKYEIISANNNDDDDHPVVATGVVRLPDICSTHHEELEVTFDSTWTKMPARDDVQDQALQLRSVLANELRETVKLWVQAFNDQY